MNTSAEITLKWADGSYTFALKYKQIIELERRCDAGLGLIVDRVSRLHFRYSDIYDTIRLGLIGGGTSDVRALELVETYIDGKALMAPPGGDGQSKPASAYFVAKAILQASYFGVPELEAMVPKEAGRSKKKTVG